MTNRLLYPEQPLAKSIIYDGYDSVNHHAPSTFIPSTTLASLLEAQTPPALPEFSIEDSPTSEDLALIYGFPAHWFGVTSTGPPANTSNDGDNAPVFRLSSNPTITVSTPESYSSVATLSPKPTSFGIDSSWMSCSGASTGSGLRHSATSSWLDDSDDDFLRPRKEVTSRRGRTMRRDINREVDVDRLRVGF